MASLAHPDPCVTARGASLSGAPGTLQNGQATLPFLGRLSALGSLPIAIIDAMVRAENPRCARLRSVLAPKGDQKLLKQACFNKNYDFWHPFWPQRGAKSW